MYEKCILEKLVAKHNDCIVIKVNSIKLCLSILNVVSLSLVTISNVYNILITNALNALKSNSLIKSQFKFRHLYIFFLSTHSFLSICNEKTKSTE